MIPAARNPIPTTTPYPTPCGSTVLKSLIDGAVSTSNEFSVMVDGSSRADRGIYV